MKRSKRHLSFAGHLLADLLLLAAALLVFAYFHHVRPRSVTEGEGVLLPQHTDRVPDAGTGNSQTTADRTDETDRTDDTDNTSGTTDTDGDKTEEREPTWAEKFAEHFTDTVQRTDHSYTSPHCSVTVEKRQEKIGGSQVTYFVADIYVTDVSCFRAGFCSVNDYESIEAISQRNDAIVSITGDFYAIHRTTSVIRNGRLYREGSKGDVCVLYSNGVMDVFEQGTFDTQKVIDAGVWQTWDFGPMLLRDGQVIEDFPNDSGIAGRNPRAGIGYYEPGHYCFVVVDGRQGSYSAGVTLAQYSRLFADLGCTEAYNLDGGQSAMMYFDDRIYNQAAKGGRNISDIIYIGEPE